MKYHSQKKNVPKRKRGKPVINHKKYGSFCLYAFPLGDDGGLGVGVSKSKSFRIHKDDPEKQAFIKIGDRVIPLGEGEMVIDNTEPEIYELKDLL